MAVTLPRLARRPPQNGGKFNLFPPPPPGSKTERSMHQSYVGQKLPQILDRAGSYTERLKKRSRIDRTVHLDRTWPPPPPRKQKFRPQNEENHHKTIGRNTGPYRYAQEIYTNIVLDREPVQHLQRAELSRLPSINVQDTHRNTHRSRALFSRRTGVPQPASSMISQCVESMLPDMAAVPDIDNDEDYPVAPTYTADENLLPLTRTHSGNLSDKPAVLERTASAKSGGLEEESGSSSEASSHRSSTITAQSSKCQAELGDALPSSAEEPQEGLPEPPSRVSSEGDPCTQQTDLDSGDSTAKGEDPSKGDSADGNEPAKEPLSAEEEQKIKKRAEREAAKAEREARKALGRRGSNLLQLIRTDSELPADDPPPSSSPGIGPIQAPGGQQSAEDATLDALCAEAASILAPSPPDPIDPSQPRLSNMTDHTDLSQHRPSNMTEQKITFDVSLDDGNAFHAAITAAKANCQMQVWQKVKDI